MALSDTPVTADQVAATAGVASSTHSFSPPDGSLVVVSAGWLFWSNTTGVTFTCKDSNNVSYGAPKRAQMDGYGSTYSMVFEHQYATAPGSVTVTVTASATGSADALIEPHVYTGQAVDQSAAATAAGSSGASSANCTVQIVTSAVGSLTHIVGAPNYGSVPAAISGTTTGTRWNDGTSGDQAVTGRTTSPVTVPGSTSVGWSLSPSSAYGYGICAVEILPAAGSVPVKGKGMAPGAGSGRRDGTRRASGSVMVSGAGTGSRSFRQLVQLGGGLAGTLGGGSLFLPGVYTLEGSGSTRGAGSGGRVSPRLTRGGGLVTVAGGGWWAGPRYPVRGGAASVPAGNGPETAGPPPGVTLTNSFDGGTQGTVITPVNSGGASGSAFTSVNGSPVYDSTQKAHGNYSAKVAGTSQYAAWSFAAKADVYLRFYLRVSAADLATGFQPVYAYSGSGAAVIWVDSGGLSVYDGSWAHGATFTTPVTASTWYRVEAHFHADTSAGTLEVRLYTSVDGTSPAETRTVTGASTGSGFTDIFYGNTYTNGTLTGSWVDDVAYSPSGWVGPFTGAVYQRRGSAAPGAGGCGPQQVTRARAGAGALRPLGTGNRVLAGPGALVKNGSGRAGASGSGRYAGPRTRAGAAAPTGSGSGAVVTPARVYVKAGGGMIAGLGTASGYSTGWWRTAMADSLVLGDIELLGGGVASANPACAGAVFRLLPGYDPGAPQPTTDFVASLILDGERPYGRRASNRVVKLPIWVIATDRDNLAAAREHLESTVDRDIWVIQWTRDRGAGKTPLPLLIDAFRGEPTVVTSDLQWERRYCMKIEVTIPAMPYARSDVQENLRFASPVPAGPPPPPSPVVIDNFETITNPGAYRADVHVEGSHSVCWDPDDPRVGDPGGHNTWFSYTAVLASSLDLTGMTAVTMNLGFGTRWYHCLPFHGRNATVEVELTLTDTAGKTISMSRSGLRLAVSPNYQSPTWSKVSIRIPQDDPDFTYTSLQGYTLKVTNYHWASDCRTRFVTLYVDNLAAYPDTVTSTVTKGAVYVISAPHGTARTAMSLQAQQPPTAGTPTTLSTVGVGNYVVPAGTAWLKVQVIGGGGAGGGRTGAGLAGGGGGAESAREDLFPAVDGETIPFTIGAGGTAGASPVDGGTTVFGPGSQSSMTVTAYGGKSVAQDSVVGGLGGTGSGNSVHHDGGAGRTATGSYGGGGGSSGGTDLPGNTPAGTAKTEWTASGTTTFTTPAGVTQVFAQVWAGGGSGGTGWSNGNGQGGGGGGYAEGYVPVSPGVGYTVVVGNGGAAVTGSQLNGNAGGNSSFTGLGGAQVIAYGGARGMASYSGGSGGAGGAGSGTTHHHGGAGGSAIPYGGGGGSSASPSGDGNPGDGYSHPGSAPTDGGAGGAGSGATSNNGTAGSAPGGGGGGTYYPVTSGAGAAGKVRLSFPGGSPDQFGATAVAGGGAGGNGGATPNSTGSAGSVPGGGGGGANSAGSAEAGGAGGAGRIVVTPYASQPWKSLIVHRPRRGTSRHHQPILSVGAGADVPNGSTWYTFPQAVSGVAARLNGTFSVFLINSSFNGTGTRTVTVTFRQVEYAGGQSYSVATDGVTFTPSQVTNGILKAGTVTLPVRDLPPDNTAAYFQAAVTDTNTSDRWYDLILIDTQGQVYVLNEPSTGYLRYWIDAPDPDALLGRVMGSQSDRNAAVSVLANAGLYGALSGGPLTLEPADQDNLLIAYCPDGVAPALALSYPARWYFDRTS